MTLNDTSSTQDPIAWLLTVIGEAQRAGLALRDPASAPAALALLQAHLPGYRQVLEQALFPLLKRRLRDDDDEGEEALRRAIFLASGTLLSVVEQLPALASLPPTDATVARNLCMSISLGLDQHLEKMQTAVLPALHTRLSECDVALLASSLGRRRDPRAVARNTCPTTQPAEDSHHAR